MDVDMEGNTPLQAAKDMEKSNPKGAMAAYRAMIFTSSAPESEAEMKDQERAVYRLMELMLSQKPPLMEELVKLTKEIRPVLQHFPKARTAKIVRTLIDAVHKHQADKPTQKLVDLCNESIAWAESEKRTFLRHRVEAKLASIYCDMQKYELCQNMLAKLLKEVKQLDDKALLVEIHLVETRCCFNCSNLPKARASLTSAKTNANAIHCHPLQQAEIDLWSGIISLRERDPRTAFSYLYEAFEAFNTNTEAIDKVDGMSLKALQSVRAQLISKIMLDDPHACKQIVQSKNMLAYQLDPSIQSILKIAAAYEDRSLKKLEKIIKEEADTVSDPVVQHHIGELYDKFLEKNLAKILEPYSRIEIAYAAELMELPVEKTLAKLSNMILDKKLAGTLDQGKGVLILHEEDKSRKTTAHVLEIIKNSADCIDSLAELSNAKLMN